MLFALERLDCCFKSTTCDAFRPARNEEFTSKAFLMGFREFNKKKNELSMRIVNQAKDDCVTRRGKNAN